MQTYKVVLSKKFSLAPGVFLLRFSLPPPQQIVFSPGQYVILTIPQEKTPVKRLYSIASSSGNTTGFDLLIKQVLGGLASGFIQELTEGASLEVSGPAGLFSLKNTPKTKVFLTTGTGIAPIRSFLLSNTNHEQPYHLFWGLPTFKDVYLFNDLKTLSQTDPLFNFTICLSREPLIDIVPLEDRQYFNLGHIDIALNSFVSSQPQNSLEYYICGRREVVESTREYLYNKTIDRELVFFERY